MAEYVTLLGAEDVRQAAASMRHSAEVIGNAASTISNALCEFQLRMDEWVSRLEALKNE